MTYKMRILGREGADIQDKSHKKSSKGIKSKHKMKILGREGADVQDKSHQKSSKAIKSHQKP